MRVLNHWNWLPAEIVEYLFLEISNIWLHYTRSWAKQPNLFWPALRRVWPSEVHSNSNYSMILWPSLNYKPTNLLKDHGWINSNRENLGQGSNWTTIKTMLKKTSRGFDFWTLGLFVFSIFCCILVQHSTRRDEVQSHGIKEGVSAPEKKGMKGEAVFLKSSQWWGAEPTKAWNVSNLLKQSSEWKYWGSIVYTWQCNSAPVVLHPAESSFHRVGGKIFSFWGERCFLKIF